MIKAILFDLDDTLYPEKQFVMSGFGVVSQYLSKKHNFEFAKIFNVLKEDFEKGLRRRNFDVLLQKLGLNNENVEHLVRMYRMHFPKISLYPDAKSALETLKGKFKLGLITDGHILTQKNKILSLGIENYFDVIMINDVSEKTSKLDVQPFLKVLFQLRIEPKNALYVGDNPLKDFISAKKIGIHTIRIKRETGEHSKIIVNKSLDADWTISDLMQLPQVIEECKNIPKSDGYERI